MPCYFTEKLMDLLPLLYRERDTSGDLAAFLQLPGAALDELKELIDRLPDIFDTDRCDARFVRLLAAIVGYAVDPARDADAQRREIKEAVESYRRKGTIPSIRRRLIDAGWQGGIEETFHKALRLNRRSVTNRAKLPGRIFSLGVYRIECRNLIQGLRDALAADHPAGMRVFFLQWLSMLASMESEYAASLRRVVQLLSTCRLGEVFVVGQRSLNSDYRLTNRQSAWSSLRIACGTTLTQDIDRAGVLVSRWHGRTPSAKLNSFVLNTNDLISVELSERRLTFTCEISTKPPVIPGPIVFRLTSERLNRSRLAHSQSHCRIVFSQKDVKGASQAGIGSAANLYTVTQWPVV